MQLCRGEKGITSITNYRATETDRLLERLDEQFGITSITNYRATETSRVRGFFRRGRVSPV